MRTTSPVTPASLVHRLGADNVRELVEAFARGETCAAVGRRFGVCREIASQWRAALMVGTRVYLVHPEVQAIADEPHLSEVA